MNLYARFALFWPAATFVLCWSSGPIFSRWGLDHGSSFAILAGRYAVALLFLSLFCLRAGRFLPPRGKRLRTAVTGFLLVGVYTICYLLALANSITPGVLSTVMGVQPILTLWLLERNTFSARRLGGLLIALGGLVLVVFQSLTSSELSFAGMLFALAALFCISTGSILQKRLDLPPMDALPLQYLVSLALCLLCLPLQLQRRFHHPGALARTDHLRSGATSALPPDPLRQPGERDQSALPGAGNHGNHGLYLSGKPALDTEPDRNAGDYLRLDHCFPGKDPGRVAG